MTNEQQVRALLAYIEAGSRILATRIALFVAMGLTFSLYCWCMYMGDLLRFGVASAFALLVFLPTLSLDKKEKRNAEQEATD